MILHNDFETRSAADLGLVGVHNYVTHPTTRILLWSYAFDDGPVKTWQAHEGPLPAECLEALRDPHIIKAAWNAGFERNVFLHQMNIWVPFDQWIDPMVNARYFSLPGSLEDVGIILKLPVSLRKNPEGDRLKKLFCEPLPMKKARKPASDIDTLFDISPIAPEVPEYVFADHKSHPAEWREFVDYNGQDVVAERACGDWLSHKQCAPMPEREMKLWFLDQKINSHGIYADRKYVANSYALALKDKEELLKKQKAITGLENPNSTTQMLKWVKDRGYPYNSLRKEPATVALNDPEVHLTKECREALTLRKQSGKISYTKLASLTEALSVDDYLRDQFMFMGSARAGRWSGKQVQLHNMARPIKILEEEGAMEKARELILANDYEGIQTYFTYKGTPGSVIDIVTSMIRSSFIAPPGMRLNVCDLNAIENRVLGWVSGEEKILDVFRRGRCPYLSFASLMYNIPYETLWAEYKKKNPDAKEKRQVAKPAVLGAGYRLSGGEWKTNRYGDRVKGGLWGYAENMGVIISQELAVESVKAFRDEYKRVVQSWYQYEDAVIRCLKGEGPQEMCVNGPKDPVYGYQGAGRAHHHLIWCDRRTRKDGSYILRIHLPSGRCLHYVNAQIEESEQTGRDGSKYKKKSMRYEGINQENKQWELIWTHGGKLIENVVQAISRDILAEAMLEVDEKTKLTLVGHIHDELITMSEDTEDAPGLSDLQVLMNKTPLWAPGLPMGSDGYEDVFYHK